MQSIRMEKLRCRRWSDGRARAIAFESCLNSSCRCASVLSARLIFSLLALLLTPLLLLCVRQTYDGRRWLLHGWASEEWAKGADECCRVR